ncbi:MAG: WD40 repeat domain-containing protein, partial [Anaerolineae bacterium]|nr:WD40 repeat domain-containing protein [Anaerolineae bacterium]
TWDYIRRWDASTGVEQPRWTVHEDPIHAIAYSPDGTQIATGGEDDIIHITDAATGDIIQTLAVHSDTITGLAYSPDGQVLVSASADRMIGLWDASTYEEITTIEDFDNGLRGIAFSRDGAVIVSWSNQGFVRLWDAATYRMLTTVRAEAIAAALSPDGHTLATSTNDHTISLWSLSDDFRDVSLVQQFAVSGHSTGVNAVSFQPDGSGLISCAGTRFSSADATLRLWDTVTGEQQAILAEFSRGATGCAYSPAGDIVAVVLADSISLRDAVSGMELMVLEGHENAITEIAFSPDGARLASASDDTTVRLWDVTSGEQVAVFEDHTQEVKALAVSADGTLLASGGGKYADDEGDFTIRLWDVKTGSLVNSLEGHVSQILSLAFGPDGVSLVSSSRYPDKAIRLWNVAAGSEELVVYSGVVARDMAFAPNGEILATATDDDLLRLWNTDMWYPLVALNAHPTNLAFNADSSLLATGSADGTIRLWGVPAKE